MKNDRKPLTKEQALEAIDMVREAVVNSKHVFEISFTGNSEQVGIENGYAVNVPTSKTFAVTWL